MDLNPQGKVAIVTRGGGGCGLVYSLAFAEEKARVVVADLDGESAQRRAKGITSKGGKALGLKNASVFNREANIGSYASPGL